MWSDNESDIDFLGYDHLVNIVTEIVRNDSLLPATIGVYGDWGSGKSSLLKMISKTLAEDQDTLVLTFNGWLFESYDDARSALMSTIVGEIIEQKSLATKGKDACKTAALKLLKKIKIFKLAAPLARAAASGIALGPAGAVMSLGADVIKGATSAVSTIGEVSKELEEKSIEDLGEFFKNDSDQVIRRSIREFREDFQELLREANLKRLVVLIDDLDRCLPDTIIATLEAIKLFLFVPHTAFVIGADERLIKYAVRRRFPELPGERAEVGRDYLEKLIQFPVRVPPLGRAEMQSYINLLFTKKAGIDEEKFEKARAEATKVDPSKLLDVRFNQGIAESIFGKLPTVLIEELVLAERIAPVMVEGLSGNPRQCKRFLNTFLMRLSMAKARGVDLKKGILVKLMLLEYFKPESFDALAKAQSAQQGKPSEITDVEKKSKTNTLEVDNHPHLWLVGDTWLRDWLKQEPALSQVDLQPYFFFSRDRQIFLGQAVTRLSPLAQEILSQVMTESEATQNLGIKRFKEVNPVESASIFSTLIDQAKQDDQAADKKGLSLLLKLVAEKRELLSQLATALESFPTDAIPLSFPLALANVAQNTEEKLLVKTTIQRLEKRDGLKQQLKNSIKTTLRKLQ